MAAQHILPVDTVEPADKADVADHADHPEVSDKTVAVTRDHDAAAAYLAQFDDELEITPELSARVRRKIDYRLLPLMATMYLMQQLDKSSVSFAAVFGIKKDANLTSPQYAWLTTIVYIGSIVGQPVSTYMLTRFPVNYWVCSNYILWSLSMVLLTACTNFKGLVALRFFLGLFEACIAPTMMILVSMWWTRREQGFRSQWWYLQNGVATILGSLLTWGVGKAEGSKLHPYQRIFITIGTISLAFSLVTFWLMPRDPIHAKFLTTDEKRVALERVRLNQTGMHGMKFKWKQIAETFMDPKTWMFVGIILPKAITAGGISAFGPLVIQGFGFSPFQTILFNMIPGAIQIVLGFLSGIVMTKYKVWKSLVLTIFVLVSLGGAIGLYVSPRGTQYQHQLLGFYFMLQFSGSCAPLAFAWANANTAGATKKSAIATLSWATVCIGNAIGPQLFGNDKPPYYFIGLRSQVISLAVIIGSTLALCLWLAFMNRRNARRRAARGATHQLVDLSLEAESRWATLKAQQAMNVESERAVEETVGHQGFMDLTDLENDEFIYTFYFCNLLSGDG